MQSEKLKTAIEHEVDTRSVGFGVWLHRRTGGRIARLWRRRTIVLTMIGRRTGRPRTVLVQAFQDGPDVCVVAANSGLSKPPGWYFNLRADPHVVGELDGRRLQLRAEQLSDAEAERLWSERVLTIAPDYGKYEQRSGRIPPIFRLVPQQSPSGPADGGKRGTNRGTRRRARGPLPTSQIADGVWAIGPWGCTRTVVYLVHSGTGWTLVDAGWPGDGPSVEAAVATILGMQKPHSIVLTHVHPDHEGDSRTLAERWRCPVWVSRAELPIALRDFEQMRATPMPLDRWLVLPAMQLIGRKRRREIFAAATLAPVVRAFDPATGAPGLPEWVAVSTPGHTVGHVSFFRPRDRVLLSGDAMVTARIDTLRHLINRRPGLSAPPWYTTVDADAARRSILQLAHLAPQVLGSGHGSPMTGSSTTQAVADFAERTRRRQTRGTGTWRSRRWT